MIRAFLLLLLACLLSVGVTDSALATESIGTKPPVWSTSGDDRVAN